MRRLIKLSGPIFLALLFIQFLSLPSLRVVRMQEPDSYPPAKGLVIGTVAIRKHEGDMVKGIIISKKSGYVPFSARVSSLRGEALGELAKYDRLQRMKTKFHWTIPINILLIFIGFRLPAIYEKRYPAPGYSFAAPERSTLSKLRSESDAKKDQARAKKE